MAISSSLGPESEITLSGSTIRYRETGSGAPVLFVHGLLVNGDLWRNVVPAVAAAGFRCVTPDLPLGAHAVAVPNADLTPPGVAALIAEFVERLDLRDVTVVANDTGGALTQLLMANHPERIGRVLLTPCDCFEEFLPQPFKAMPTLVAVPGVVTTMAKSLKIRALRRLPIAFGWLAKRPAPNEIVDNYLRPLQTDRAIRADGRRFVRAIDKRYTLDAVAKLRTFDKPIRLVWAAEDKVFKPALARRLHEALPSSTLTFVDDSYTFVAEDQPDVLAREIVTFARAGAAQR